MPDPNKELEERVKQLGKVTLDGFEKLSRRVKVLEQERNPSSLSLSSLNKTFLILVGGFVGLMVFMSVMVIVFHQLGIDVQ